MLQTVLAETRPNEAEFPDEFLQYLRCTHDGNPLHMAVEDSRGQFGVIDATLECAHCAERYHIIGGIARMLPRISTAENDHEIARRDDEYGDPPGLPFVAPAVGWRSALSDRIEIPPFMAALGNLDGKRVLDIGCGDGRFAMLMAQRGAKVVALDFSLNGLTKMAGWLAAGVAPTALPQPAPRDLRGQIALVQADASQFQVAAGRFDRALSTTPLDGRGERLRLYDSVSAALADDGSFIGSVEHDDLHRRSLGLPVARRYEEGAVFIEHFSPATIKRETAPFFGVVQVSLIRPRIPLLDRLPARLVIGLAAAITRLPVLRGFGEILLFRAARPLRPATEGEQRQGFALVRALYAWRRRHA